MIAPRISLLVVALLAGVGWRVEVEWHGWASIAWVSYFHWALPAGALLFAGWLAACGRARRPRALAAGSLILAGLAFNSLMHALLIIYSRWPQPPADVWLALGLGSGTFWLYPVAVWAAGRLCGSPVRLGHCAAALALWVAAVPMAIGVLLVTEHVGGADFLHAIKSGVVIPFLLIALGLPFVWPRAADVEHARR